MLRIMPSREELKALIDQIPEDQLDRTASSLRRCMTPLPPPLPPPPNSWIRPAPPELAAIMRRVEAHKQEVMRRFQESGKTAAINTNMLTFQFGASIEEVRYGGQSFHYWDENALVNQEIHYFDGRELEIMVRFSISQNQSLCCAIEVSSGGKTVRHSDEFPTRLN
jgi:hypothetical protein